MLLKDTFHRLINLRLSQANSILMKKLLITTEGLAKNKQQLGFRRRCTTYNVFPQTIRNLHLPTFFQLPYFKKSKHQVQSVVLNKCKQHIRSSIARKYAKQRDLYSHILSQFPTQLTKTVSVHKYLAYNTASKYHSERLNKKLEHLCRKNCIPTTTNPIEPTDINNIWDTEHLVTDLTDKLTPNEKKLLAKGPKYSPSNGVNDNTITDMNVAFYRIANQIRWRESELSNTDTPDIVTYPKSSFIRKPDSSALLEEKLRRIHLKYQHIVSTIKPTTKWTNLTPTDISAIKTLQNKDNIYLPSDKGTEFCVVDKITYNTAADNHLQDTNTYRNVSRMSAVTIEKKINKVWKDICNARDIPKRMKNSFVSSNTDLPQYYQLIKNPQDKPRHKSSPYCI